MSAIVRTHGQVPGRAIADGSGADASTGTIDAATVSTGMAVALGAVTMTFAALLLAIAIVRVQATTWPPVGEPGFPRVWSWPLGATFAALLGSAAMAVARRAPGTATVRVAVTDRLRRALVVAAAAGTTFVAVQVCGWRWLISSGIRPSSGMAASVVYALTLFHALHAAAALVVLVPTLVRAIRGRAIRVAALAAVSSFWHLVTVLWLVVCVVVFVA